MAHKLSEAVGIDLQTAKTRMTRAFKGNELTTRGELGAWEAEEGSFYSWLEPQREDYLANSDQWARQGGR